MGNGTFTEVRNMDREKVWGDEIISSVLRYMGETGCLCSGSPGARGEGRLAHGGRGTSNFLRTVEPPGMQWSFSRGIPAALGWGHH